MSYPMPGSFSISLAHSWLCFIVSGKSWLERVCFSSSLVGYHYILTVLKPDDFVA